MRFSSRLFLGAESAAEEAEDHGGGSELRKFVSTLDGRAAILLGMTPHQERAPPGSGANARAPCERNADMPRKKIDELLQERHDRRTPLQRLLNRATDQAAWTARIARRSAGKPTPRLSS